MNNNLRYIAKTKRVELAEEISKDFFLDKRLGIQRLSDAVVLPWTKAIECRISGGVVSNDGKFIISSAWHEGFTKSDDLDGKNITKRNETVIYIGCLYHVWGHAITDNLKKIWYLRQSHPSYKYIYITVGNETLPSYVFDVFKLAHIDLFKAEQITEITKFSEVIIPDNALTNKNEERFYTKEFAFVINDIRTGIESDTIGKVYLTRSHLNDIRDKGEKYIERAFRKKGYRIVAPEELSLKEQLKIIGNCTTLAATEGSISHSAIFCKPNTKVVILRKVDYVNPYTCFINQMCNLDVVYIDIHHSSLASKERPWLGPFYLYFTKELSQFLGYYGFHLPYYLYPSWYEYRFKLWTRIIYTYNNLRASVKKLKVKLSKMKKK